MPCEDYPCCGHAPGDCPEYDKNGRLKCTCGKVLPKGYRYSICRGCLDRLRRNEDEYEGGYDG